MPRKRAMKLCKCCKTNEIISIENKQYCKNCSSYLQDHIKNKNYQCNRMIKIEMEKQLDKIYEYLKQRIKNYYKI